MPLLVTGGFRTRAAMDEALQAGEADLIGLGRPLCADADVPNKLLSGDMATAPAWEKTLRLGPTRFLGPNSPLALIKGMNGWGQQGWFCAQIKRMGDGLDPDLKLGVFKALRQYQSEEGVAAKAYQKTLEKVG